MIIVCHRPYKLDWKKLIDTKECHWLKTPFVKKEKLNSGWTQKLFWKLQLIQSSPKLNFINFPEDGNIEK